MRPHNSFQETRNIPIKLITLSACLLALAILFSTTAGASANPAPENGTDPFRQNDFAAQQVAPEQDASLSIIDVTVNGDSVTLVPAFDPDTTHYTATVNSERVWVSASVTQPGAGIDQTSVGDETLSLDPPGDRVSTSADLTEGAITTASLRVLASDRVTTKTYHLFLSRPAGPAVPDISMAANTAEYTAGLGRVSLTLTREGDTADSLDVTVIFTQERAWLSDADRTATFAAGDAETILSLSPSSFSSTVTRSGEMTATVDPVTGYDTSGAIAHMRVISQEGPAVTVTIEHPTYTVDEDAGTLEIALVARAHHSVSQVSTFSVTVQALAGQATSGNDDDAADYGALSDILRFAPSDFQEENGSLAGRKTVSITILDDDTYEGDEQFHVTLGRAPNLSTEVILLDPEGEPCVAECPNHYVVTIKDNDGSPVTVQFGQNAYTVAEGGIQGVTLALSDDPERTVVIPITATRSRETQDFAAASGHSGIMGVVLDTTDALDLCNQLVSESRMAGHEMDIGGIPFFCYFYVAETEEQARRDSEAALNWTMDVNQWRRTYERGSEVYDNLDVFRQNRTEYPPSFEYLFEHRAFIGNPDQIIAKIRALQDAGIGYFGCNFSFGGMPQDKVLKSMELFAEKVMPEFA